MCGRSSLYQRRETRLVPGRHGYRQPLVIKRCRTALRSRVKLPTAAHVEAAAAAAAAAAVAAFD